MGLVFEDESAQGALSASAAGNSASAAPVTTGYSLPSVCEAASDAPLPGKKRLLFKTKAKHPKERRLHAKGVEVKHGVKISAFERLGGIAFAEMKNASLKQFCQMFVELENDPVVEFVEEDLKWVPLGNKLQVEDMLFPPPKLQPDPPSKLHGRMNRGHGACTSCGRSEGHPNDGDFDNLWGLHQEETWAQSSNSRAAVPDLLRTILSLEHAFTCQSRHYLSIYIYIHIHTYL